MTRTRLNQQFESLERVGIHLDGAGSAGQVEHGQTAAVRLRRGTASQDYTLVHVPGMTFTEGIQAAREISGSPVLVMGDHVSERSADSFRQAGVQYVDAAGNAYITFGDVLIDIRGRRRSAADRTSPRPHRAANLFSSRRARVVFALLAWPELVRATVREIAAAAGVSVGLAHDGLEQLEKNGYIDTTSPPGLRSREELLDHWTAAYPSGLAPTLELATFAGEIKDVRPVADDQPLYVSGEAAVPQLIRPVSLLVYVDKLDPRLPVINRWRSDAAPNITVRQKFWSGPAAPGQRLDGGLVPWPLVYADLMATGESRQRAAAEQWRGLHAGL